MYFLLSLCIEFVFIELEDFFQWNTYCQNAGMVWDYACIYYGGWSMTVYLTDRGDLWGLDLQLD